MHQGRFELGLDADEREGDAAASPGPTVKVTAPSNAYGTSTPGVLRPSERRKTTR